MKQYLVLVLALLVFSCKNEDSAQKESDPVLEKLGGDYYQDMIRTPVNPDGTIDTSLLPRIMFEESVYDFGDLGQTDKKSHTFAFKNTGKSDLIILDVKTSCGCTVASYNEDPIKPGESGEININYDPKNRKGLQEKGIIVTTNSYPNKTELTIIANVLKD